MTACVERTEGREKVDRGRGEKGEGDGRKWRVRRKK